MKDIAKHISRFTKKEIDLLFQTCKAMHKSKECVILTTPCSVLTGRILLITSRKVGSAPERNLLRRRGRAIFYEAGLYQAQIHCVVIFKSPAIKLSYDQFKMLLVKAIAQSAPDKGQAIRSVDPSIDQHTPAHGSKPTSNNIA